jgi:hypothetical protein
VLGTVDKVQKSVVERAKYMQKSVRLML